MKPLPTIQQKIEKKAEQKLNAWLEKLKDDYRALLRKYNVGDYDFQIVMRATDDDKLHYPFVGQFFHDDSVIKQKMRDTYLPSFINAEIDALLTDKSSEE